MRCEHTCFVHSKLVLKSSSMDLSWLRMFSPLPPPPTHTQPCRCYRALALPSAGLTEFPSLLRGLGALL
jgi:hypothetical protein